MSPTIASQNDTIVIVKKMLCMIGEKNALHDRCQRIERGIHFVTIIGNEHILYFVSKYLQTHTVLWARLFFLHKTIKRHFKIWDVLTRTQCMLASLL